jgi:competence protein ComEC
LDFFKIAPGIKRSAVTRVILILTCLWLFSLITGASASVLRSAVMFTCIIIGKEFFRKASIYNSIAASAFLLLVYDPYLLWDVGFQLSYFAVGGIVWLQKPVYNLLYVKNKALRYIWEMCSITIAAQVLTFPICIYYFHQFPASFLFTNLICVPLSTVILFAEIGLVILSWIPPAADMIGNLTYVLTWLMNTIIVFFDKIPGSLIDRIYATPLSTWLLYLLVFCTCSLLLYKSRLQLKIGLLAASSFRNGDYLRQDQPLQPKENYYLQCIPPYRSRFYFRK